MVLSFCRGFSYWTMAVVGLITGQVKQLLTKVTRIWCDDMVDQNIIKKWLCAQLTHAASIAQPVNVNRRGFKCNNASATGLRKAG